jgi:hypothetical protein
MRVFLQQLITAACIGILLCSVSTFADTKDAAIGEIDYLEYWSAATLFVAGGDPYDMKALNQVQALARTSDRDAIIMWNPPWIFPTIAALTLVPANYGPQLWFFFSIILYVYCLLRSLSLFNVTNSSLRRLLLVNLILFPPIISCLTYGQLSVVLLLGWIMLLTRAETRIISIGMGVGVYLTSLKPHLLYLPYMIFLLRGRIKVLLAGAGAILLTSVAVLLVDPGIFQKYLNALQTAPPTYWKTPTLGALLQEHTSLSDIVARTLPHLAGLLGIFLLLWKKHRVSTQDLLLISVPLSLFFNAYGWMYDQLLLVPTIIWSLSTVVEYKKSLGVCYALLFFNMVYLFTSPSQHSGIWYPLLIGLVAFYSLSLKKLDCEKNNVP